MPGYDLSEVSSLFCMAQANGNGFVTLYLSTLYFTNDQKMVKKWPKNTHNKLVSIFHIHVPMSVPTVVVVVRCL